MERDDSLSHSALSGGNEERIGLLKKKYGLISLRPWFRRDGTRFVPGVSLKGLDV